MHTTRSPQFIAAVAVAATMLLTLATPAATQAMTPQQACVRIGGTWVDQKVCIVPDKAMLNAPPAPVPGARTGPGKAQAARAAGDPASAPPPGPRGGFVYRCLELEKTAPLDTFLLPDIDIVLIPCKAK
ncbi:MAG: hypothetical protein IV094_09225 [Vitreoscilla sp.]|nr:hypothetical protein [Vitreoscilla sp.]